MNRSFWKNKRVLITGHTGFKGSWLSLWLQKSGSELTGFALLPPTNPSLFELAGVGEGMNSVTGDVRDYDSLAAVVAGHAPEVIIHLAAQSVVRASYEDPRETYSTNVMGTVNLFEAVRRLKHPCVIVNVTSDKCYENREWLWGYRENEPMGGHDPYSNSKGCAELVTSSFRESFFNSHDPRQAKVALASARAGNVIGGGDWTADQLVPDIMRAFIAGKPVAIRNPRAVRPWQFVLEPLDGYLTLAERLAEHGAPFAEAWNFGPDENDAMPVSYLVESIARLWGDGARWEQDAGEHPHEAGYLKLDISKAKSRLGWKPRLRLTQALEWVVQWYKAYQQHQDVRDLTNADIERFEKIADGQR